MGRKILMRMNNIRLTEKVVILFLVCVLIPLITTNGCIYWSMKRGMDKELQQKVENITDCLEYEISGSINEQISIADYLNRNSKLKNYLGKRYPDASAYYDSYVQLMEDDVIHYYYMALSAYNIVICTGNDTIVNGTYFVKKEDVAGSSWYQAFQNSGRQIYLYSYYEDGKNSSGYIEKGRHVVVMQNLNECGADNMIMLDLDYQSLLERVVMLSDDLECYICSGDYILFSTEDRNGKEKEFLILDEAQKKEYAVERELELYGMNITIRFRTDSVQTYDMVRDQKGFLLLLYTINLLLPSVFIYILYRSLHDRVAITQEYLNRIKEGIYEVIPCEEGTDEIGGMLHSYNLMVLRIKELIEVVFKNKEREQSLELSKKQAELHALQSQLNPHFIFNALESIRMHSILKQETETARILENFAVLMRRNIQWNKDFVTIEEECENVKRYLEIQKYRFGERLEFFLYIQEECKEHIIPKFIIITFVENACVHGIEKSVEGGSITVMISEDEEHLYFEIMDSGSGMESEELALLRKRIAEADIEYIQNAKKSIGIINAVVRMKQYYGEDVQIDISSMAGEGTEISIQIPREDKTDALEKRKGSI